MSQPYGQQPPGNFNQGQPGYGAMPPAPPEYTGGPVARPGSVTAAAVLGFVQAGLTIISTIILLIGLAAVQDVVNDAETINGVDVGGGGLAMLWIAGFVGLIGAGLLIWGAVKALGGTAGNLLVIAAALQIVLCVFWLIEGAGIIPILLIVMPIIALVMSLGSAAKQYEASKKRA
jgi:hypothetical protein